MKKITVLVFALVLSFNMFAGDVNQPIKNLLNEVKNHENLEGSNSQGINFVLDNYSDYLNEIKISNTIVEIDVDDVITENNEEYRDLIEEVSSNINFKNEEFISVDDRNIFIFEKDNHVLEFKLLNEIEEIKKIRRYLTASYSLCMKKSVNYYKTVRDSEKSKSAYGYNLNFRYNITDHFYTALNTEYRSFVEERNILSDNTIEIPIVLQFGSNLKFANFFEVYSSFGAGINIGIMGQFYSLHETIAQFDLGTNIFLNRRIALNAKSTATLSHQYNKDNPKYSTMTLVIVPIQLGMTIGI